MIDEELIEIHQETVLREQNEERLLREAEALRQFIPTPAYALVKAMLSDMEANAYDSVSRYRETDPHALLVLHTEWIATAQALERLEHTIQSKIQTADEILEARGISLEEWRMRN